MGQSVIIGGETRVTFGGCALSAQWAFNPGFQPVYCLGDWDYNTTYSISKPSSTLSITIYAGGHAVYATLPTQSCASDAGKVNASVSPTICGTGTAVGASGQWFVTGYSYSKDTTATPGQESWSLMQYPDSPAATEVVPTKVLRGLAQGQTSDQAVTGINLNNVFGSGSSGSVSAGAMGKESVMEHGQVSSVGGGEASGTNLGTGSASIPYIPLYI